MACDDQHERGALASGFRLVAGVDEVGRGALAGPVVAAAVILDLENVPAGIDDSKRLRPSVRERLANEIRESAIAWSVARVEADEIDRINILRATLRAMRTAVEALAPVADIALVDGNTAIPGCETSQRTIVGGDAASISIAAASIVAKVTRDELMRSFDSVWNGYGFALHAGYGTRVHRDALRRLGPTPIHRLTFRGVGPPPQPTLLEQA
jgi:ribonuclease HII